MATLQQLLDEKAALEAKIEYLRTTQRAEAISQVRTLMEENGLTLADLASKPSTGKVKTPKVGGAGAKVAAKYRDETTGDSWSGRGLQPRWLKAAMANGKKLEDFAV